MAIALAVIAVGVYLPSPGLRAVLVLAIVVAALIWIFGEAFGEIMAGGATDVNSGPLLILLALAYWPLRKPPTASAPATALAAEGGQEGVTT
jgi:hypothetical protein